jgi:hypothetical protein
MLLGARVRTRLLRQAHSTRLYARISAMPLSKGLSRRLGFCVSAIPLGQLFLGFLLLESLSSYLCSLLSVVLVPV